jgi:mRNA interferase MazF
MITSAENGGWPGDVTVNDLDLAGLPVPSVIRSAKIATMEVSDAVKLGKITSLLRKQVMGKIGRVLGL